MHKLERYGVVALVFLLVTILAVSLWSGSEEPEDVVAQAKTSAPANSSPGQPPLSRPNAQAARPQSASGTRPQGTSTRRSPAPRSGPTSTRQEAERLLAEAASSRGGNRQAPGPNLNTAPTSTPVRSRPVAAADSAGPLTDLIEQDAREQGRRTTEQRSGAAPSVREVVVRAGDTLSGIAQRELGGASRWREIAAANPSVDPDRLYVGTKLRLPSGGAPVVAQRTAEAPTQAPAAVRTASGTYTVRAGDTLSRIAARELGSADRWRQLVAANPGLDPNRLLVGAKLRLPGATPAATPPATNGVNVAANSRGWSNAARYGKSGSKGRVR